MGKEIDRLGGVLIGRMQQTAKANDRTIMELGVINGDLSLTVDSIPANIPPKDYMVALDLTHENYLTYKTTHTHSGGEHAQEGGSGSHTHTDGLHDHRVPSVFRRLQPGDRVLVAWIGFQPVIISVVVAGTTITPN